MGHESIVYGAIIVPGWKNHDHERLYRLNQAVMLALPPTDVWPFLTSQMFTIGGTTPVAGCYRSQVIHFGATFKAVEWEWDEWLEKFEQLLARLFWDDVYLHLRTEATVGDYDYHYTAQDRSQRFYKDEPPMPADHWTLTGGPRSFPSTGPDERYTESTVWEFVQGRWKVQGSAD